MYGEFSFLLVGDSGDLLLLRSRLPGEPAVRAFTRKYAFVCELVSESLEIEGTYT